jgi:hypothetical protein
LAFAEFYTLMAPDNPNPILPNNNVEFLGNGPSSGSSINRAAPDKFILAVEHIKYFSNLLVLVPAN